MYVERFLYESLEGRPSCHVGTIVEMLSGEYMAAFYAGTCEGHPDVALLTSWLRNEMDGWTPPRVVLDPPGKSAGNAVLHVDLYGHVWMFYTIQQNPKLDDQGRRKEKGEEPIGWDSVLLYAMKSEDEGRTWEEPTCLSTRPGQMVKNKPIRLASGRAVLPCYDEMDWRSFCLISDDECRSWTESGPIEGPVHVIQPTLYVRPDGSIVALMRSGADGDDLPNRVIWRSVSTDDGMTWSRCEPTDLPNPNSGFDLARMDTGQLALVFNNSRTKRTPLTVALSGDEGETWPIMKDLETEEGAEFSYPSVIQGHGGRLHMIYTYKRTHMKHVAFSELWFEEG